MTTDTVTVVVAGDHDLGDALRSPRSDRVDVIDHVTTGNQAVARVLTELPDVLLLDTRIEETDARAVCRRLREWAPATRVLAATGLDDERAYTTVVAGAAGAVFLTDDDDTVTQAVHNVARGEALLLTRMAVRLLHDLDAWAERSADPLYPPPTLTATEREVLTRIGEGADSETIAAAHAVTPHLVNLHAGFAVAKLHRYVHGAERIAARQQ
ncbi:MAG: DNA-binding response regulator [Acidimicrobiales bacterium]|nr:MAG: DNA-binding response regulator [Acidimicrobiales bacterium]